MTAKTADDWFTEYGICHQNHVNKVVHWIRVPLIMLSILGLLWGLPVPDSLLVIMPWFNWAIATVAACLVFYLRLSSSLATGMLVASVINLLIIASYERIGFSSVWVASLVIFVLAWLGQFVGHKIEGQKPAFFDDLKFLLIGPIWLLAFIYRRLGIPY